jgi:hypothetical protein
VNWRAVIVVVFLGVVIAWVLRSPLGWPEADFTAEEKTLLDRLSPMLETLVLQEEDLSFLSGYYEACEGGMPYGLRYDYDPESGEVEDVQGIESDDRMLDEFDSSAFCNWGGRAFVSSIAVLPDSKETLIYYSNVAHDLARGEGKDLLEKMVEAARLDLHSEEEVVDYAWLQAPPLGDARYAWVRTVEDTETGDQFELYRFRFNRGVVMAGLLVKLPSSPTAENEALLLAKAFDDRIAAQLQSLTAEALSR